MLTNLKNYFINVMPKKENFHAYKYREITLD